MYALGGSQRAEAEPVVKLQGQGILVFANAGPAKFALFGQGTHLGRYTCHGEVAFIPGQEPGSLIGVGVTVFEAANGDLLVGDVRLKIYPNGEGEIAFPRRDSVTFSDGTTVESTGGFVRNRPGGALVGHGGIDPDGTFLMIGHGGHD